MDSGTTTDTDSNNSNNPKKHEYKEGDVCVALCENCYGKVEITFKYRNYTLINGKTISNVLLGICNYCDAVLTIPHQEMKKIRPHL